MSDPKPVCIQEAPKCLMMQGGVDHQHLWAAGSIHGLRQTRPNAKSTAGKIQTRTGPWCRWKGQVGLRQGLEEAKSKRKRAPTERTRKQTKTAQNPQADPPRGKDRPKRFTTDISTNTGTKRTNSINCFRYYGWSRRTPGHLTTKLIKIGHPSLQTCRIENSAVLQKLEACGTARQCSNQQLGVGLRLQSVWRTENQQT